MSTFQIGRRVLGPGQPCFIIAEAGVNHDGRLDAAMRLIDVAVQAGVDAIKFQTFIAAELATPSAPKAGYQLSTANPAESQLEMLRRLQLTAGDHRHIADYCASRNIMFLSTPFDIASADMLDALGVPAFKISSGDLTNLPLISHVAGKGKPVLLSTGMATLAEIEPALRAVDRAHAPGVAILHCVSNYPAQPRDVNLRAMHAMADAYHVPVGYSDHTAGIAIGIAAVAMGACILEKHFTLDRSLEGPDHQSSLEPRELSELVRAVRDVESAFGDGRKVPADSEAAVAAVARKSVVAATDIPSGTTLTDDLLAVRRPGTGLPPAMQAQLVGRRAICEIPAGTAISLEMLG